MKKDLSSILLVVSVSILSITSAVGWVYNYQLQKEIKSLRSESQSWRNFALDATTAYVKSHGGIFPKGTLVYQGPPAGKGLAFNQEQLDKITSLAKSYGAKRDYGGKAAIFSRRGSSGGE